MTSRLRLLLVTGAALLVIVLAGCGSPRVLGSSSDAVGNASTDNPFIPTNADLSDCVGTLERPGCETNRGSDVHMYLTFGALMGGMALIGWRIAVSIRHRDRDLDARLPEHTY